MSDIRYPSRVLLTGDTLRIGFHGVGKQPYTEGIVPAAVLRALAQHAGVDTQTEGIFWGNYCFFAGMTGEAFRFVESMGLAPLPPHAPIVDAYGNITMARMYELAFRAAGLEHRACFGSALARRDAIRHAIVESVGGRHAPAIGFGVFEPPEPPTQAEFQRQSARPASGGRDTCPRSRRAGIVVRS